MKKIILAANWKLNKSPSEARSFFQLFLKGLSAQEKISARVGHDFDVIFFPPAISLESTSQCLSGTQVRFGAQNIFHETKGAFTGENSAEFVKELGGGYILIGHSERRQYFHESSTDSGKKIRQALQLELKPMYCIGETLAEREAGKTESVLQAQINEALSAIELPLNSLVIAYEPVWAIGTGKIASDDQIKTTHAYIQKLLANRGLSEVPILYGGSVKAANAAELIKIPYVSGFLVGGASLEAEPFLELIKKAL